jgi:hypothetical protein
MDKDEHDWDTQKLGEERHEFRDEIYLSNRCVARYPNIRASPLGRRL